MTLNVCIQHRVIKYYQVCSNDDPVLTLTYFMARSTLAPYAFVLVDVKKGIFFSETIAVYDIKVGRCNHSDSIFLNFFSSITADFNISSALR